MLLLSVSVSVPSVTVVVVAFWVRGICKYSALRLSMKHSSAIMVKEAWQAMAAMVTKLLSLEKAPQDRRKRSKYS